MPDNLGGAPYSEEEKARVLVLWGEGRSVSEIALAIGAEFGRRRTRNAIIGVVFRHGEQVKRRGTYDPAAPRRPARVRPPAAPPKPPRPPRPAARALPPPPPPKPSPHAAPHAVPATAARLLEIGLRQCRFPVGEATGVDQLFCGARAAEEEVYCAPHRATAGGARIERHLADREAKRTRRGWW